MNGNVKNWKSFNENITDIKDFDSALSKLTAERDQKFFDYLKNRFENIGMSCTKQRIKFA
jgi:hypothetical protein